MSGFFSLGPAGSNPIGPTASARLVLVRASMPALGLPQRLGPLALKPLDAKCLSPWVWAHQAQTQGASGIA